MTTPVKPGEELPLDYLCPKCRAEIGAPCLTKGRIWRAKTHAARWRMAGIKTPTTDDLMRNYMDIECRGNQRRLALAKVRDQKGKPDDGR